MSLLSPKKVSGYLSHLPGYRTEWLRAEPEKLYSTMEDFRRADPTLKRMLVVGSSGAGKSTLLNIIGGWNFVQQPPDYDLVWEHRDGKSLLFKAEVSSRAVTEKTEFAHLSWFGNQARPFTAIDTRGLDDPDFTEIQQDEVRDKIQEMAVDLHNKLQAMGHVHMILILHNDVHANRLNPAMYEVLKMVDQKFAKTGQNVWQHVAIAYTKCNEHDHSWRSGLALKKTQQQEVIRRKIAGCDMNVPIFALGGAKLKRRSSQDTEPERSRSRSPRRSQSPRRAATMPDAASQTTDFDRLWEFLANANALDTSRLQPFEGADVKWQRIIDARNEAEARAKAARIYIGVLMRLCVFSAVFFWRAFLIPSMVSRFLLLNFPGPFDEVFYLCLLICWIGPEDVWYSLQHFYREWIKPRVQPYLDHCFALKND